MSKLVLSWGAALLLGVAMVACGAEVQGQFCAQSQLTFSEQSPPWWRVNAGADTTVVAYVDASGDQPYEEIALQLTPQGFAVGTHELGAVLRQGYYQRGGRVRTFVSRTLSGTLTVSHAEADRFKAKVELTAAQPTVDQSQQGTVSRTFKLAAKKGGANLCQ